MVEVTHSCERHQPARRCYTLCKCRCPECREAHRQYAADYSRRKAYGVTLFVDPQPVIDHLERLAKAGVGWKQAAAIAGVSKSSVWKLRKGRSDKVRVETAKKLLAVEPVLADGARIPAGRYFEALRVLQRRGWTKTDLGRWVHGNPDATALQLKGESITVAKAKRIVALVNLIEADRVRCMRCGTKLRNRIVCLGGCRVRQQQPA